jgi:uncharacterized protein (DUF885 family)
VTQPPASPARPVDTIADTFVEDYCVLDPVTATYLGVPGHDDRLTDYSPDGYAAREALTRRAYEAARDATPTDERERVAQEAFLERLGLELEMYDAHVPQSEISVISSALHQMRSAFDLMDTDTEEAWRNIDARLAAWDGALAGLRASLVSSADAGHVAAKRQLHGVADQIRH